MKIPLPVLWYALVVLTFSSCNKDALTPDVSIVRNRPQVESDLPFSDTASLSKFDSDKNIVDYSLARKIAILDMTINNYFEDRGWRGCKLSCSPIILYGTDNKPLFYDFIVLDGDRQTRGTVTVHARKRSAMQIKAMTQNVPNYGGSATKSGREQEFFADMYGNRYIATSSKSGEITTLVDIKTNRTMPAAPFLNDDELMYKMRHEYLPAIFPDPQMCKIQADSMEGQMREEQLAAQNFWNTFAEIEGDVRNMPENNTESAMRAGSSTYSLFYDQIDTGTTRPPKPPQPPTPTPRTMTVLTHYEGRLAWLKEYNNWFKTYKYNGGYCGPWIVGFILSANYNNYLDPLDFDKEGYTV